MIREAVNVVADQIDRNIVLDNIRNGNHGFMNAHIVVVQFSMSNGSKKCYLLKRTDVKHYTLSGIADVTGRWCDVCDGPAMASEVEEADRIWVLDDVSDLVALLRREYDC